MTAQSENGAMMHPLDKPEVRVLLTKVEEASRSTEEGVRRFVEPAQDTLRRATSRRPHLVFGRRGSGKTTLLRKAAQDLTVDRRPIAFLNLEVFKGHTYPDVLLSILIATFDNFNKWLGEAAVAPASKTSFWKSLFGSSPTRAPFDRKRCKALSESLNSRIGLLREQLYSPHEAKVTSATQTSASRKAGREAGVSVGTTAAKASVATGSSGTSSASTGVKRRYSQNKIDFLTRSVLDFQEVLSQISSLSQGGSFLFLDDLYFVRREDQPRVADYFHALSRETNLWVKIGTIRHRTTWYRAGDPPMGLKLGDDADEIDLDVTLEHYETAKQFLMKILTEIARECGVALLSVVTEGAVDRLVLASGGVARDFLGIFRKSVAFAVERGVDHHRGSKVGVEDVNQAAGQYDISKRQELQLDTQEDRGEIEDQFEEIRNFCLNSAKANCFLIDQEARGRQVQLIDELVDLKLIHRVVPRVTVGGRRGRIYRAFMLDVSQYTGSRKRRGLEIIPFWDRQGRSKLRRAKLIYETGGSTP